LAIFQGVPIALAMFMHTALADYASFILFLAALYTVACGILVTGSTTQVCGTIPACWRLGR
jgi:hypothetical protein